MKTTVLRAGTNVYFHGTCLILSEDTKVSIEDEDFVDMCARYKEKIEHFESEISHLRTSSDKLTVLLQRVIDEYKPFMEVRT